MSNKCFLGGSTTKNILIALRAETALHQRFSMAREACALRASHGLFIGWRTDVNNLRPWLNTEG